MDVERDDLGELLRAIARDDAVDAARSLPRLEARLAAEIRARRPRRAQPASRVLGLAMAAVLAAALAAPVWLVTRGVGPAPGPPLPAGATVEIATAFMPLAYETVPFTDARLVRIEVPRAALAAFGLAPIDAVDAARTDTVLADVVVGEDGLARAVRFIRAPRAPGVAP